MNKNYSLKVNSNELNFLKQSIRKNIQTYKETKNMNDVFFKTCVEQLETLLTKVEKLDKRKVKTPLNPAFKTLLMSVIPSVK
jgi:CRISPR/Cas system CMR subunit Cmr6 (Cas7 group RAMP superfamily)